MTDETQKRAAGGRSDLHDDETMSLYALEAEQLRHKVADLLLEVEALRDVTKSRDALDSLVVQLRLANQHLVIATMGAQGLQAVAEAANRRQEEFLAMLAHELRNPLAPVAMATELLGRITDAHPQLPKLHGIISRQVSHVTRLVDDLLDASRFSSGKIELHMHAIPLSGVMESAMETSQPFLDKRHQRLTIDMPAYPIMINGDMVRLAQVFSNLLINAAKFTPEYERIAISVRLVENNVLISVKDNGIGIAAEAQPFIFELFTQGFHSTDRSQGGLGIGLSLVRVVVQMHGGTVIVKSDGVGLGSEFIVQLPVAPGILAEAINTLVDPVLVSYGRILLIEDNTDAVQTLSDLLELEGYTISSALDGPTGLKMAEENEYDFIVCDIGLPNMDGYEVAKQLRLNATMPAPCLIALTGYNRLENQTRANEAGFNHYLVKPVAIATLVKLISSIAEQ
jgi:signal transduction histidine kinase